MQVNMTCSRSFVVPKYVSCKHDLKGISIKITWEKIPLATVGFIAEGIVLFDFFASVHISLFLLVPV